MLYRDDLQAAIAAADALRAKMKSSEQSKKRNYGDLIAKFFSICLAIAMGMGLYYCTGSCVEEAKADHRKYTNICKNIEIPKKYSVTRYLGYHVKTHLDCFYAIKTNGIWTKKTFWIPKTEY